MTAGMKYFIKVIFTASVKLGSVYHERGFTLSRFHDFETTSKLMRFGSVYTEPFSPENSSHDGISERCTTCLIPILN